MSFLNEATAAKQVPLRVVKSFVLLLAPFAPHMCEELWQRLGESDTLAYEPWPTFDPALTKQDTVTIAVQVCGKMRDTFDIAADASKQDMLVAAKALEKVQVQIAGKELVREIVVPGRLVNLVVK